MQECHNLSNVVCPFCGYKMPVEYSNDANCNGVFLRCKGRSCKKIFELRVESGKQILRYK